MHAKIIAATTIGIDAHLVEVEVDVSFGLVNFFIVGLPDTAIKESSKRIQTALKNCGVRLPTKKITVNLAPAHLKKEGTLFDLPIAIGILLASEQIEISQKFLEETVFLGELSLDGSIKFIKGALAIAYDSVMLQKKRIILPKANAAEAVLIKNLEIVGVNHLTELIAFFKNESALPVASHSNFFENEPQKKTFEIDFSQVKGQHQAKRALQIAAAGRHNVIFIGPPGSGKTMLAQRLATIMPPMHFDEKLQTSKIYSICGKLEKRPIVSERPMRAPHHSISQAGLIGGGSYPQPGEISLAHNGILFLDELMEFRRESIEALRQPLESHSVSIARAHQSITFPANFLLVAALNPCPCGFFGDKTRTCLCSRIQISKYLNKLSGPLLDRIDLQIPVSALAYDDLKSEKTPHVTSASLYEGVLKAVSMQKKRFNSENRFNNTMNPDEIIEHCVLTEKAEIIVKKVFERLHLSMRGYHKLLKVARTIADIEESSSIDVHHIQEAVMYRSLDQHIEQQKL